MAGLTPHNEAEYGQIAKTVLMPGDPLRAKFIAETFLTDPVLVNNVRGIQGYTGTWKGVPVTVMASGMGIPSIGIYSWELYTNYGVENIICVGYMLANATMEAAQANPDQKFAIIDDATCADLPNVACLMFAQEQASYLVGLVAGSVTESKTVGYVQGMVSDAMNQFGVGYIAGVLEACPEAEVLQYNANNFGDIAGGATAAKDMITKGADVIYHAAGGTGIGVINACAEEGVYAIGVDTDQSPLAPEYVITSAMKRVDTAAQDISKSVADGTYESGVHLYDLSNGGVDLSPTRDLIPEDVLKMVEDAKAKVMSGEIVVPSTAAECPEFVLAE